MSRDNHENSDGDNQASASVESKDDTQGHGDRFGGFTANNDYEYEEPDRDIDYNSVYSNDNDTQDTMFDSANSDDEQQDVLSFEEGGEERYDPDPPLAQGTEDWPEGEVDFSDEHEDKAQSWPLGLIAVAAVALMLLAAGSYGVIQERAEVKEELRQLRETLTTVSGLEDADASRSALRTLKQSYDALSINAEALVRENRQLTNVVAGLRVQLDDRKALLQTSNELTDTSTSAGTKLAASDNAAPPAPEASPTSLPATTTPSATMSSGVWFVNVSSYSTRAAAERWMAKVRPAAGKVIVSASTNEGKTYYRVRVVGLANKSSATQVARELEATLDLNKLWVGRE